ncbi:hypothetical protein KOW79_004681, partial [Hemibagrus wyckioides]
VTLAEAEEKHQKIISQLEEEMFDLTEKVETLRDTVKILMKKLIKTDRECDERINVTLAEAEEKHQKDVETIHQLEKEKDEMKKTLNNKEEFLKVTLAQAEEKHQKIISQLEEEMFDLTEKVTLAEAEEKHQKDVETIHQLEEEKDEMKKILINKEEFLKHPQYTLAAIHSPISCTASPTVLHEPLTPPSLLTGRCTLTQP